MSSPQKRPPLRSRPTGWPVGSFDSYEDAQAAVDKLSDLEFPVADLTIVGVDLMEVERVSGRLTWPRVLGGGAASGAWIGIFFGLLLSFLGGDIASALMLGLLMGVVFGVVSAAVPYALSAGKRDFTSRTEIVAGRYDVLADPARAAEARDIIARSGLARQAGSGG